MSPKLKVTLGILLLVAGFLVVRLGLFFKHSIQSASRFNSGPQVLGTTEENPAYKDYDHDGIADEDEAYYRTDAFNRDTDGDGYLDGEEVATGTNPTKKDPPKVISQEESNLTKKLTSRAVAGIYAGDLNLRNGRTEKYQNGLDALALATIDDALNALRPAINERAIQRGSSDNKQAQEEYLNGLASLLEGPFLSSFMAQPYTLNKAARFMVQNRYDKALEIFNDLNLQFVAANNKLLTLNVPPKWLVFHKHLLAVFRKISADYSYMGQIKNDPVLALAALQDFQGNIFEIDFSLLQELRTLVINEGLQLPNSVLFKTIEMTTTEFK